MVVVVIVAHTFSHLDRTACSHEPIKNACHRKKRTYIGDTLVPSAVQRERADNPPSNPSSNPPPDNDSADQTNQTVKFELAYAFGHAERAPSNESPWNYIRGFFRAGGRSYADFPEVKERALALQVSPVMISTSLKPNF